MDNPSMIDNLPINNFPLVFHVKIGIIHITPEFLFMQLRQSKSYLSPWFIESDQANVFPGSGKISFSGLEFNTLFKYF